MKTIKQRGFSLLEILIAFSILAVSLSILLNIFSLGVTSAGVAEDYTAAVQIAESLMAKTGVDKPLQVGESAGIIHDQYHWQVLVQPFALASEPMETTTLSSALFKVRVTVHWGDDKARSREVKLVTLKLVNKRL
ncbi:MAG: type II secretion system protein [Methylococcales bacterium]|nr:type II secretion system protein [Methylococcales bacterium]